VSQAPKVHRRNSVKMAASYVQAEEIIAAVTELDNCDQCDVHNALGSKANAWVKQCRTASAAIAPRHKKEFITCVLEPVFNSEDKKFGLVTVNERQCCCKCFKFAYGFDKSVFSAAKGVVETGEQVAAPLQISGSCKQGSTRESNAMNWCHAKYRENLGSKDPISGMHFSVISRYLRDNNILTMEAFLIVLRGLNTKGKEPKVTATTLDWMYDFSSWALDVVDARFQKFTKHHVFRFKKVKCITINELKERIEVEEVRMHVKEWAREDMGKAFPYVPDLINDRCYGYKVVNNITSKGGQARYEDKHKIPKAAFTGKLDRTEVSSVMASVKNMAGKSPRMWEVPFLSGVAQHVDTSPLVQQWERYLGALPLHATDVEHDGRRPWFFPWPQRPTAREHQEELRPDLPIESAPLKNPIQGSRMEGQGSAILRGPVTGKGLDVSSAEHEARRAATKAARREPMEIDDVEMEPGGGEVEEGGGDESGAPRLALGRSTDAFEEDDAEDYEMEGIIGAQYKKSDENRVFQVLWAPGTVPAESWEPEREGESEKGIDPTHVYGPCFDKPAGMTGRRILFSFATGTSSNIQDGEALDKDEKRKRKGTFECIVKEVRDEDVMVAWEVAGEPEEDWVPEALQLHTLERGTEWKLLTDARRGFLHGLKVSTVAPVITRVTRTSKRQRT